MAFSMKTVKLFTLFWDIFLLILALVGIGIGIHIYQYEIAESKSTPSVPVIAWGTVLIVYAILGCFAVIRESSRLLKVFAYVIVIFVIAQIVGIIYYEMTSSSTSFGQSFRFIGHLFESMWVEQSVPREPVDTSPLANLERSLDCCGNSGPSDYILPPNSCYNNNEKLNLIGCRYRFEEDIAAIVFDLKIVWVIQFVVELICATLSFILAANIRKRWRVSQYYTSSPATTTIIHSK